MDTADSTLAWPDCGRIARTELEYYLNQDKILTINGPNTEGTGQGCEINQNVIVIMIIPPDDY